MTRKNPFLLGWEEGTGRKRRGKETARDGGRRKEGKEPTREKERFKLLEIYKKGIGERGSFDPWDNGFKCQAKVLNTRGNRGKK